MNQELQNLLYKKALMETYGNGLVGGCSNCGGTCGGARKKKSAKKVRQGKALAKYNKLVNAGYSKSEAKRLSGMGMDYLEDIQGMGLVGGRRKQKKATRKNSSRKTPINLDRLDLVNANLKGTKNRYASNINGVCSYQDPEGDYYYDPASNNPYLSRCSKISDLYRLRGQNEYDYLKDMGIDKTKFLGKKRENALRKNQFNQLKNLEKMGITFNVDGIPEFVQSTGYDTLPMLTQGNVSEGTSQ